MPVANQRVYSPASGAPIESTWGQGVAENVVQVFASTTERDADWTAPPDGSVCQAPAGTWYHRVAGVWKQFPMVPAYGLFRIPANVSLPTGSLIIVSTWQTASPTLNIAIVGGVPSFTYPGIYQVSFNGSVNLASTAGTYWVCEVNHIRGGSTIYGNQNLGGYNGALQLVSSSGLFNAIAGDTVQVKVSQSHDSQTPAAGVLDWSRTRLIVSKISE